MLKFLVFKKVQIGYVFSSLYLVKDIYLEKGVTRITFYIYIYVAISLNFVIFLLSGLI